MLKTTNYHLRVLLLRRFFQIKSVGEGIKALQTLPFPFSATSIGSGVPTVEACFSPSEMYRTIICTSVYYFGVKAQAGTRG